MVKPHLEQWTIKEGKGRYTGNTTKAEIKDFLVNPVYGLTTDVVRCVVQPMDGLSPLADALLRTRKRLQLKRLNAMVR